MHRRVKSEQPELHNIAPHRTTPRTACEHSSSAAAAAATPAALILPLSTLTSTVLSPLFTSAAGGFICVVNALERQD
jgi:hypothetical protein